MSNFKSWRKPFAVLSKKNSIASFAIGEISIRSRLSTRQGASYSVNQCVTGFFSRELLYGMIFFTVQSQRGKLGIFQLIGKSTSDLDNEWVCSSSNVLQEAWVQVTFTRFRTPTATMLLKTNKAHSLVQTLNKEMQYTPWSPHFFFVKPQDFDVLVAIKSLFAKHFWREQKNSWLPK